MNQPRCVGCGSSQWDSQRVKCGRCGKPMAVRSEVCYISDATKLKLLIHAKELSRFGVQIEQPRRLQKKDVLAIITAVSFVVQIVENLRPGATLELVRFLLDLAVPKSDILALRLGEPEEILEYCRMDQKEEDSVIKWRAMKKSPRPKTATAPPPPRKRSRTRKNLRRGARRKPRRL